MFSRYSEIYPNLYQGARPSNPAGSGFDVLVLCDDEFQPPTRNFPGLKVIHAPLQDDDLTVDMIETAVDTATQVASLLNAGNKILVTCNEGRNRSGLVVGLALIMSGMPSRKAIALIRKRRKTKQKALTNSSFVEFLKNFDC